MYFVIFSLTRRYLPRDYKTSTKCVGTALCLDIHPSCSQCGTSTLTFPISCAAASYIMFFNVSVYSFCFWPARASQAVKHLTTIASYASTRASQTPDSLPFPAPLWLLVLKIENCKNAHCHFFSIQLYAVIPTLFIITESLPLVPWMN